MLGAPRATAPLRLWVGYIKPEPLVVASAAPHPQYPALKLSLALVVLWAGFQGMSCF